jgi:hypothetical protein
MRKLPKVGEVVQLFGIGCEGCGHFRGQFEVREVVEEEDVSLVLDPQDIRCEGPLQAGSFARLTLLWNRDLECWHTRCGDHDMVVHISGHYSGPARLAA